MPQASAFLERLLDRRVGIEHALAVEQLDSVEKMAARVRPAHRSSSPYFTPVTKSSLPWPGRGMNGAGALLERDVIGQHANANRASNSG